MGDNFLKIKSAYKKRAVIAGAILGVCCALIFCCLLLVILKLCGVSLLWCYYVLIGAALSLAFSVPFFAALYPDDSRIAKKLDDKLNLNQRVQTMVEYASDNGAVARLQRQQADGSLTAHASKKFDFGGLLKYIFIPVLALAMLFAGIFVPARKSETPIPEEPGFEATEYQLETVKRLVADVNSSSLDEDLKAGYTEVLNGLVDALESTTLQSAMRQKVTAAITVIDGATAQKNTYLKIGVKAAKGGASSLAYALSDGANAYRSTAYKLSSMDSVRAKEQEAEPAAYDNLNGWLTTYAAKLSEESEDGKTGLEVSVPAVTSFAADLSSALSEFIEENEGGEEDGLYMQLTSMATTLEALLENKSGYNAESFVLAVKDRLQTFVTDISKSLAAQSYNVIMDDYVRTSLAKLFNVTPPPWQTALEKGQESGGKPSQSDEGETGEGGGGKGEEHFGTDDVIYDPETNGQVKYTEVLGKYYAAVLERIAAGASNEELAQYIKLYFNKLSSYVQENK